MNKTLKQLKVEEGKVYFRKYENYNCKLLEGNVSATNYCIAVKTEDKAYVFFSGSTYRKKDITVIAILIDPSEENILKVIGEPLDYDDGITIKWYDDVTNGVKTLIEDNATWIEDEVETLMSLHGINISISLEPDQITSKTVDELRKALDTAESVLKSREPLIVEDEHYHEPEQTIVTSDGCVFEVEPSPESSVPLLDFDSDMNNQDEFDYLESLEDNRFN